MEPSSSQTWAQRSDSSNQRFIHSSYVEIPFISKKQHNGVRSPTSPEIESSSDDNHTENEHEKQLCTKKATYEALVQRCEQLQEDVKELASHMDDQKTVYERKRTEADNDRRALLQRNATLERELDGLLRQNTRMAAQRAAEEKQAADMHEAHDEVLRALVQQQQQTELFHTAAICASQDKTVVRIALKNAQLHCCRLEKELALARAQVVPFHKELVDTTVTGAAEGETHQLQAQDQRIANVHADLVQIELKHKTVSADNATLQEKLQLRSAVSQDATFDVVRLGSNGSDVVATRKCQKKRTTIRPVKANKEAMKRHGSDIFNNLMELPNALTELQDCANATIWLSPPISDSYSSHKSQINQNPRQGRSFRDRIALPSNLTSFVAKTVQSARYHVATPLQSTFRRW